MTYSYTCRPTARGSDERCLEKAQGALAGVEHGRDAEGDGQVAGAVSDGCAGDQRYAERRQALEHHVQHLAARRRVLRAPEVRLGEVADHHSGDAVEPPGAE